jgi:hypothetical protein
VRTTGDGTINERLFRLGIISALFHDCGYIRRRKDTKHANGAEYTTVHVSRGAHFLEEYLPTIGMADLVLAATRIVHFTGYEIPVDRIKVPSLEFRLLGNLLGSADILAQMADRCYLEKCYDRLYPEFVRGGIARKRHKDGSEEIVFASAADLIQDALRGDQAAARDLAAPTSSRAWRQHPPQHRSPSAAPAPDHRGQRRAPRAPAAADLIPRSADRQQDLPGVLRGFHQCVRARRLREREGLARDRANAAALDQRPHPGLELVRHLRLERR